MQTKGLAMCRSRYRVVGVHTTPREQTVQSRGKQLGLLMREELWVLARVVIWPSTPRKQPSYRRKSMWLTLE